MPAAPSSRASAGRAGKKRQPVAHRDRSTLNDQVSEGLVKRLAAQREWAADLDPEQMEGLTTEVRMLRQALRDEFVLGRDDAVRQCAEALRRLLRDRAIVPEMDEDEQGLEDGLSADLRRVLNRVGMEMGVDA